MEIPPALLNELKSGRVVLFLGAGASKEARNGKGEEPPSGGQLAKLLADKFLGGKHIDKPLSAISELAISETDLVSVQNFIGSTLDDFHPSNFHKLIPTFRWRAIVTTNYDCILEEVYDNQPEKALQKLIPFISNSDRIDEAFRSRESLPYLKLHGSINRLSDQNIPLILTPDQYVTHSTGRYRLFNLLKEWGHEYPIVFVGYGLQDLDLRSILLDHENEK